MPRAPRGSGSVWKKPDGRWGWAITTAPGKKIGGTEKTKEAAARSLEAAQLVKARGSTATAQIDTLNQTVEEYLRYWLDEVVRPVQSANGTANYRQMCERHVIPSIGKRRLRELNKEDVNRLIREVERKTSKRSGGPLSAKTVRNVHGVLSSALTQAVEWGRITENPAADARLPRAKRAEIHPFDEEEARRFLTLTASSRYSLAFSIAVVLGLRKTEILSLEWRDWDFPRGRLHVRGTKTRGSDRTVRVPVDLLAAALEYRKGWQEWKATIDGWSAGDRLFVDGTGKPVPPRTFYRSFETVFRDSDLRRIRFHDLRHTAATIRIMRGEPIHSVAQLLGHSKSSMTLDSYMHVVESMTEKAADKMSGFLPNKPSVDGP